MGRYRTSFLMICLLAILTSWPHEVRGVARFLVAPPMVNMQIMPGRMETQVLSVINQDSSHSLHLRAYVQDWDIRDNGETEFQKTGAVKRSCAGWIEINPVYIEVPPLAEQSVRFTVVMPESAAGSYWAVIFFESRPESLPLPQGVGVSLNARVGSLIFVDALGTLDRQMELVGIGYRRTGYKSHEARVRLKNNGNAGLRPKGKLYLRTLDDRNLAQADIGPGTLLPQRQRDYPVSLNLQIPPGEYKLLAEIEAGTGEIVQGEIRIKITE